MRTGCGSESRPISRSILSALRRRESRSKTACASLSSRVAVAFAVDGLCVSSRSVMVLQRGAQLFAEFRPGFFSSKLATGRNVARWIRQQRKNGLTHAIVVTGSDQLAAHSFLHGVRHPADGKSH